ncbi:MAG TPA: UDP-glucose 4-epimerase GalE [Chthoniobacterales bacterium]|nr:UDP-glucose 4-epimerase GalE [Chthoniobacterales bacterium]
MKIFVTGGAGYVGSICVEELLQRGDEVIVFDNLSEGHRLAIDPSATFIQGDLNDSKSISLAIDTSEPDAVMHFAANALVAESMQNPYKYFHNNVCGGLNLLNAMVENGVRRLVFSSTCATFGTPDRVPIDEDTPQNPINPYGESKLMFEKILRWFDQVHGLAFVALRYFNVAGASEKYGEHHRTETHLIPRVLQVALGHRPNAEIYGTDLPTPDGTCVRDYIHVRDLASAHILALSTGKSGFYNLGTGGGTSVREVINACRKVTGHAIPTIEKPRRAGDPARLIASSEKARQSLGWKPQFENIEAIVESAWRWHSAHPAGYQD